MQKTEGKPALGLVNISFWGRERHNINIEIWFYRNSFEFYN